MSIERDVTEEPKTIGQMLGETRGKPFLRKALIETWLHQNEGIRHTSQYQQMRAEFYDLTERLVAHPRGGDPRPFTTESSFDRFRH